MSPTATTNRRRTTATAPPAEAEAEVPDVAAVDAVPMVGPSRRRFVRGGSLPTWLRADSASVIWFGVAVALIGFGLIAIAWGQVAGETQVYLQLPYIISAGFTGLGLVMVGVTIVNVSAKRRDAAERDRQMDQLVSILEELKSSLSSRGGR